MPGEDAEAEAVDPYLVADFGRPTEPVEDEPGEGVEWLLGELDVELLAEIVDRECAVDPRRPGARAT